MPDLPQGTLLAALARMRCCSPLLLLVLTACGGPRLEGKTVASKKLIGNTQCSQAPIVAEFVATGSKYGEGIEIRACSPQGFDGRVRLSTANETLNWGEVSSSSDDAAHAVCRADTAQLVHSGGTATTSRAAGGASSHAQAPGSTRSHSADFVESDFDVSDACFGSPSTVIQLWPLTKGTPIVVELWSALPNMVLGTKILIRHKSYWPNVSEKEWERYVAKRAKKASDSELEDDGDWTLVEDDGPSAPPPPAKEELRPPRPTVSASWRPGYWHWMGEQWLWIAGAWQEGSAPVRVAAPPAPRIETRPPRPGVGFVWMPGHYSFDGVRFTWVAGLWIEP